ncbi:helix-turn-helix domain-containing protein [Liquorilactobacillus capillatus]|uniref:Cro CI family transcriptional regulator n=1 Tax=Liquorilactobacillus capillatus DSM 19910 TaxID=1423731 RepID=A0A0R1LY36_9LACO|nr:helix-turn-helix transcriptional regulator [Liquorilactobacillus capillatus]KRL00621.1 Cro CI family transcriptional regulator [Liquorilactobacillus capillatus DSM 19910]
MFPERLKALRKGRHLTLAELAAELNKIDGDNLTERPNSGPQIGSWERGINTPSYLEVLKLARFFRVTLDFLVGNKYAVRDLSDLFAMNTELSMEGHILTGNEREAVYGLIKSYLRGKYPLEVPDNGEDESEVTLPLR